MRLAAREGSCLKQWVNGRARSFSVEGQKYKSINRYRLSANRSLHRPRSRGDMRRPCNTGIPGTAWHTTSLPSQAKGRAHFRGFRSLLVMWGRRGYEAATRSQKAIFNLRAFSALLKCARRRLVVIPESRSARTAERIAVSGNRFGIKSFSLHAATL